jgi:hypothetical protein
MEERIVKLLVSNGFILLDAGSLRQLIQRGDQEVRVYRALFTDSDSIPGTETV